MESLDKICALICAYNEQATIAEIVSRTKKNVSEVYVVDDGSTDRTYLEALDAGAKVIRHEKNKGKGQALKTGFSYLADKDYQAVITLDADGQHLPEEISRFKQKLCQGSDVVIGKRDFNHPSVPKVRRFTNKLYTSVLTKINRVPIYDAESGYRAFKKQILPMLASISPTSGFSYESEMLIGLLRNKVNLGWVDISTVYIPGRISKIKPIKHVIDSAKVCLRCIGMRYSLKTRKSS